MEPVYRIKQSREQWKDRAKHRAKQLWAALRKLRRRDQRITQLLNQLSELKQRVETLEKEKAAPPTQPLSMDKGETRVVCVLLVIRAVISFRSAPRVLKVLQGQAALPPGWTPHFTSIIHWTLRVGLARLQAVKARTERWIAIMDCSIDIGVRKALVVLRVNLDTLASQGNALSLSDCECIGIRISTVWNGKTVAGALKEIFAQSGKPTAILKDQGTDLNKGVRLWRKANQATGTWVIDDIGHAAANGLKKEFAKLRAFKKFLRVIRVGCSRLRQTDLAFLMAPKVRTKGRFQGISRVAEWAKKMIDLISGQGRDPEGSPCTRLRRMFAGLSAMRAFIERFAATCRVSNQVLELLKKQGLNQKTYRQAQELLTGLSPRSKFRKALSAWLRKHLRVQCRLGMGQTPLPVSSDIIESLLGKFKIVLQRCGKAEMNRMVLSIPCLCGKLAEAEISAALASVTHEQLRAWERQSVPETMEQFRRRTFSGARRDEWVPEVWSPA